MTKSDSRLLPLDSFAHVFEPLLGKRVGYVRPKGNVGDRLIEQAMVELFDEFGVRWRHVELDTPPDDLDELVFGGGGNMGSRYQDNWLLRGQALELGLPLTILPQSFSSDEARPFRRVFVRERASLAFCPSGTLAPDLALGLRRPRPAIAIRDLGIFLRRDPERIGGVRWFSHDPARLCQTPEEYLSLAAKYRRIVTDRLHFAISGLLVGREVTLLANDYHKNQSMHETWLADLGCHFAHDRRAALRKYAA